MGEILPNSTGIEFGFAKGFVRFTQYQLAFPPIIVNNTSEAVTWLPFTLKGHVVILPEHQEILNVLHVAKFEREQFASQHSGLWIPESELRKDTNFVNFIQ